MKAMEKTLTKQHAVAIVEAHEIAINDGDEETDLLKEQNPELYEAYKALIAIAEGP